MYTTSDGWSKEQIVSEIEKLMGLGEFKALSGICHNPGGVKEDVMTSVFSLTAYINPLNPDAFPGIRKMEAEVVRMAGSLFHGDREGSHLYLQISQKNS